MSYCDDEPCCCEDNEAEHDSCDYEEYDSYDCEDGEGDCDFQDPGGESALRRATPDNPRIYPCPTCHEPDMLTAKDVRLGYQCDRCAERQERGVDLGN